MASFAGRFGLPSRQSVGSPVKLDRKICRSARLARDARFDGKFFIGVRSTGIFCRPVCPARSPQEQNVEYYATAAACVEAGLRPCLRCRPESSPGTPAWVGTSVTVSRALRLIGEGALEDEGVDALAERLGIGSRHLRRLFLEHLGATPVAVAQTRRLLAAKKLIDETSLPLTEIAIASGYGSIRRFNAAFRASYGRGPRELRKERQAVPGAGSCTLQLRFRPPYDYGALLEFLRRRAIPGVEYVAGDAYRRTFLMGGGAGWLEVRPNGLNALTLRVERAGSTELLHIAGRVRRLFDLDADPLPIGEVLSGDPVLRKFASARPGLRVPGAWDGFELGVRAILGQQVSVAGASTLSGRVAARFGRPVPFDVDGLTHTFPTAGELAEVDLAIGIPAARAEAIREFARATASGEAAFHGGVDTADLVELLCAIRGIGPWTAQYIAMRALSDPDAFPADDLALLRATGEKTAKAMERRAEPWRPWRAYAAMHIWQGGNYGKIDELHMDGKPRRQAAAGGG